MMARFFLNRRSFFIGRKKVGKNDSIFLKANNIFSNQTRSSLFLPTFLPQAKNY